MSSSRALVFLTLVSFIAVSFAGCDRCSSDDEEAAQQSVAELGVLVPATADVAVVVPELSELPDTIDYAFQRFGHFDPDAAAYEQLFRRELGFQLTDIDAWDEAGFDTDGSLLIAAVGSRPVLTAHLDDEDVFEQEVIEHFRGQLGTEGDIGDESFGDRSFRISGDGSADDMAWFFDDSRVVWIMPAYDAFAVYESGSAASVANKIGGMDEDVSLAQSDAFVEFQKGIGNEYPISLYLHAGRHLEREEFDDDALGMTGFESLIEGLAEWSQSNAEGAGVGLRAGDQRVEIRTFLGGDDEIVAEARESYQTEADVDWSGLLTEETVLGTRTAFDLQRSIDTYFETLPDDQRRMIRRELQQLNDEIGLDIEEDVLAAFSGHTALAFQGITDDVAAVPTMVMRGHIDRALQALSSNTELLVSFHFADIEKMSRLAELLEEQTQGFFKRQAMSYEGEKTDDVEVIEPADVDLFPLRLAIKDDVVTFATAGVGEDELYEYLTTNLDEPMLADSEDYPLGARFADSENANALYLNFANLRGNMRNIGLLANYAGSIEVLHELLMTAGVDDHGFYVDAIIEFTDALE